MTHTQRSELVQRAATLFKNAHYSVAFSGAGISTDSGIPDFRSPHSGLWENVDPFTVASIYGFKRDPQAFYDWVRPLTQVTLNAKPNPAHCALVKMEKMGRLQCIATQNIDGLHTRAGSQRVFELHGHLREATCIHCFTVYNGEPITQQILRDGRVPHCPKCQGVLKPNVILFGEQLPINKSQAPKTPARQCDLMLIVGSSLEVAPANQLPVLARSVGARLVIVNLEPTHMDNQADVVIHGRAAEILPEIVRELEEQL